MAFIVFEGLDASGKSTLISGLSASLKEQGLDHWLTREPGGSPLGDELRAILLRKDHEAPSPRTEILLYEAARSQHVDNYIRPRLDAGLWVLCDRFTASTVAFQEGGRGIDKDSVRWLNDFATGGLTPHLNILLDLPVEESLRRMNHREASEGQEKDRFEEESRSFHQTIRESYLRQAAEAPNQWLVLDACLPPQELCQQLITNLKERGWLVS